MDAPVKEVDQKDIDDAVERSLKNLEQLQQKENAKPNRATRRAQQKRVHKDKVHQDRIQLLKALCVILHDDRTEAVNHLNWALVNLRSDLEESVDWSEWRKSRGEAEAFVKKIVDEEASNSTKKRVEQHEA